MNRYAFVIPTKDRPKCIEYYLENQGQALARAGFVIIICDSSADNETKDIVARFKTNGLNIIYDFYDEKDNANSIDEKGFAICKKYCGQYDYIWLCSDGTVIDVERVFPTIKQDFANGKDLVILSDMDVTHCSNREFFDAVTLCQELCWRMLLLGSTIVSRTLLQETVERYPYRQEDSGTIWLPAAYFKVLSVRPFSAAYHSINGIFCNNPFKKGSFWYLSGNAFWQWGKMWCDTIDSLPECFDQIKDDVLLSHDRHMRVFSIWNLQRLRSSGNLTFRKMMRYRKYLKRVTDTPLIFFALQIFFPAGMRLINLFGSYVKAYIEKSSIKQRIEKENGEDLAEEAAALLEQANIDKKNGLPERLFICISSLIPIANVDLFILDKSGRLLLTYREDEFYGAGWHIPGGCLRFGETMLERIHKTAQLELGFDVDVCRDDPLAVRDVIRKPLTGTSVPDARGHNLAVLYLCSFSPEAEEKIEATSEKIRWFERIPEDILPVHAVYDDVFIQYGLKIKTR